MTELSYWLAFTGFLIAACVALTYGSLWLFAFGSSIAALAVLVMGILTIWKLS